MRCAHTSGYGQCDYEAWHGGPHRTSQIITSNVMGGVVGEAVSGWEARTLTFTPPQEALMVGDERNRVAPLILDFKIPGLT